MIIRLSALLFFSILSLISFGQGSGNTLSFNGSTQAVNLGDEVANGCRSIEMWFKPDATINSSNSGFISLIVRDFNNASGLSTDEFGLSFYPNFVSNPGKLSFFRRIGSTQHEIFSNSNNWLAGHWYHVAVSISSTSGMKMYINGVLQSDTDASTNSIGTQTGNITDNVSIAKWGSLNIRYFNGEVDEVRLWEDTRTQTEIREHMCSKLVGNESGLRAYYTFNSNTASSLEDESPNSYDGSMLNLNSSDWIYSGAPIGDTSTYVFNGAGLTGEELTLEFDVGDLLRVYDIVSDAEGLNIYRVNESPNEETGLVNPLNWYYGVFFSDHEAVYNVEYDLSASPCTSCDRIYTRNDNAKLEWQLVDTMASSCIYYLEDESSVDNDYRAEYIRSNMLLEVNLGNDTNICSGTSLLLNAYLEGASYLWQDGSTDAELIVDESGLYWVEVSLGDCSVSDSISILLESLNDFDLGNDTLLCDGETLVLSVNMPNATYTWQDNSSMDSFLVSNEGLYWLEVTIGECSESDSIYVEYTELEGLNPANDTSICEGDQLVLNAYNEGATYLWQDGSTEAELNVIESGLFWVLVSIDNCSLSDSINVSVETLDPIDLGNDTLLCGGETLLLSANLLNANYTWQDNSSMENYLVNSEGLYWVEASNGACIESDSIYVEYSDLASLDFGNDTTLCEADNFLIETSSLNFIPVWQDNSSSQNYLAVQTGIYWAYIQDGICVSTDSIAIEFVEPINVDLGADTSFCEANFLWLSVDYPGATYLWQDGGTSSDYLVDEGGIYSVDVNLSGCVFSDDILIEVQELPQIELGSNLQLCDGQEYILGPFLSENEYVWNDGSTANYYLINEAGSYTLSVSNNCGTSQDDISVDFSDCTCYVYIPNAFTPSGDGRNDFFYPVFDCAFWSYSFTIMDRWGEIVFDSRDEYEQWDGKLNGNYVQNGVYTYYLNYSSYNTDVIKKIGIVNVIR